MFLLLMSQAFDLLGSRYVCRTDGYRVLFVHQSLCSSTRLLNWNISLSLLLAAILVFIPLSYSLVVSDSITGTGVHDLHRLVRLHPHDITGLRSRQRPSIFRIFLNFIPVGLFLFFLEMIPLPSALPTSGIIVTTLSRLTVLGTIILGLLSGFGAINTAWVYFPGLRGKQR